MSNRSGSVGSILACVVLLGIVLFIGVGIDRATFCDAGTFTVTDKGIKRVDENSDQYLIYTTMETFKVTDSLAFGRFNSSDVYGRIQVGHRYNFKVCGYRVGFTSSYRNVIEVREVFDEVPTTVTKVEAE